MARAELILAGDDQFPLIVNCQDERRGVLCLRQVRKIRSGQVVSDSQDCGRVRGNVGLDFFSVELEGGERLIRARCTQRKCDQFSE